MTLSPLSTVKLRRWVGDTETCDFMTLESNVLTITPIYCTNYDIIVSLLKTKRWLIVWPTDRKCDFAETFVFDVAVPRVEELTATS